jgi:hypothetical protein
MNTSEANHQAFKASVRTHWDAAARGWDAHSPEIRAWLRSSTDAMIAMAGVTKGMWSPTRLMTHLTARGDGCPTNEPRMALNASGDAAGMRVPRGDVVHRESFWVRASP